MTIKTYTKPGDWQGTTRMLQKARLSFHNGFGDDEALVEIESDISYIHMRIYDCDDWTGKVGKTVLCQHLTDTCISEWINVLYRAKEHKEDMKKKWAEAGKKWLSSNGGDHPGPTDEQNRIYLLPWNEENPDHEPYDYYDDAVRELKRISMKIENLLGFATSRQNSLFFKDPFSEDEHEQLRGYVDGINKIVESKELEKRVKELEKRVSV